MSKLWKIIGIATLVAILGVMAVGVVAYAQNDEGEGWPFNFHERFKEILADKLGVTVGEYDAAVEQAQGQVVDEALEEGWLTEDQAERMRERAELMQERMDQGFGFRGRGKGFMRSLKASAAPKIIWAGLPVCGPAPMAL